MRTRRWGIVEFLWSGLLPVANGLGRWLGAYIIDWVIIEWASSALLL
jgi:hypothetical protein